MADIAYCFDDSAFWAAARTSALIASSVAVRLCIFAATSCSRAARYTALFEDRSVLLSASLCSAVSTDMAAASYSAEEAVRFRFDRYSFCCSVRSCWIVAILSFLARLACSSAVSSFCSAATWASCASVIILVCAAVRPVSFSSALIRAIFA